MCEKMNKKKLIISFFILSFIFSSSAFAFPTIPCAFFGTVNLNGNPVNGTLVTAHLNDTGEYLTTAKEIGGLGNYSITIDATDKYIRFKIAGIWANEPEQLCTSGGHTYLDLTASTLPDGSPCDDNISCTSGICLHNFCRNSTPYVGDGYCDPGENCLNSIDCTCPSGQNCGSDGNCFTPQTTSGGGGGFSGGGGGLPSTCVENWTCTDWSECTAGTQTRTCTDLKKCGTTKSKPSETQSCEVQAPLCTEDWSCTNWSDCVSDQQTRTCTDANACGTTESKPDESQNCVSVTTSSAITGLFLGLTTTDWITALIAGIIVALIIIFLFKRRSSKKK
jgi:hypothetical protein